MKIKEVSILYLTLFLHAIAEMYTGYFEGGTLNPGTIRGGIVGLFIFYFLFIKKSFNNIVTIYLILYLIYLFLLSIFSSNISGSMYYLASFSLSVLMFPIGYYYIDNINKLFVLSKYLLCILGLFAIYIVVANIFEIGSSDYLEGSFYFGVGRVNITKTMIILLFTAPIYLYYSKPSAVKVFSVVIYITTLAICLIGIKRSVLLSLIFGGVILILMGPNLVKSTKYYLVAFLLILTTYPIYGSVFTERLDSRHQRIHLIEENLDTEARYNEVFMVKNAMETGGWKHRLIGSEPFNDREYFNTDRMLHTDYMIMLNGTGIVGFIGWVLIIVLIVLFKNRQYIYRTGNSHKLLNAVFWMLIIAQILMSISGTVYNISLRSYLFLLLGAIIKVMSDNVNENAIP